MFFLQKDITKDQQNIVGFEGGGVHGRLSQPMAYMYCTFIVMFLCTVHTNVCIYGDENKDIALYCIDIKMTAKEIYCRYLFHFYCFNIIIVY